MEVTKTHCYICNCRCGVLAYVENGRVKKVEGDPACEKNEGALCIKGRSMLELVYDEDQIGYPIKRHGSAWKRISWEDALSEISERLLSLKHEFGPESFVLYRGMSVYSWLIGI